MGPTVEDSWEPTKPWCKSMSPHSPASSRCPFQPDFFGGEDFFKVKCMPLNSNSWIPNTDMFERRYIFPKHDFWVSMVVFGGVSPQKSTKRYLPLENPAFFCFWQQKWWARWIGSLFKIHSFSCFFSQTGWKPQLLGQNMWNLDDIQHTRLWIRDIHGFQLISTDFNWSLCINSYPNKWPKKITICWVRVIYFLLM